MFRLLKSDNLEQELSAQSDGNEELNLFLNADLGMYSNDNLCQDDCIFSILTDQMVRFQYVKLFLGR